MVRLLRSAFGLAGGNPLSRLECRQPDAAAVLLTAGVSGAVCGVLCDCFAQNQLAALSGSRWFDCWFGLEMLALPACLGSALAAVAILRRRRSGSWAELSLTRLSGSEMVSAVMAHPLRVSLVAGPAFLAGLLTRSIGSHGMASQWIAGVVGLPIVLGQAPVGTLLGLHCGLRCRDRLGTVGLASVMPLVLQGGWALVVTAMVMATSGMSEVALWAAYPLLLLLNLLSAGVLARTAIAWAKAPER